MPETVDDLRTKLISLGLSPQEADSIKGKNNLMSKISELEANASKFSIVLDTNSINSDECHEVPLMTDPKWSDYVMSKFTPDELFEGHPKIDGLRRVTELLVGRIISSECHVVQAPSQEREASTRATATVEHKITVVTNDGYTIVYNEVSDAARFNTDNDFGLHLSAIASTRAEGRALRKLLKLKNIVSAEELTTKTIEDLPPSNEEFNPNQKMTKSQLVVLQRIAQKTNINLWKYVNSGKNTYESFNDIPYQVVANQIFPHIQFYQQINNETKELNKVPQEFLGYNENDINEHWND